MSVQWTTVKHTLHYLNGTKNKVLTFRKYTDVSDRKSTTGYCMSLKKMGH